MRSIAATRARVYLHGGAVQVRDDKIGQAGSRELRRARRPRRRPRRHVQDVAGPPCVGGLPRGVSERRASPPRPRSAPPGPTQPGCRELGSSPPAPTISPSFLRLIFSNPQPPLHCRDNLLRVRQVDCCVLHPLCIFVSARVFCPARCCHRSSAEPPRSRAGTFFPVLAVIGHQVSVPKPLSKGDGAPPLARVRGQMV